MISGIPKPSKWEYLEIDKGTILFRGKKTDIDKNRPTYFAETPEVANLYLPSNKKGFLKIYETSKNLKLFNLGSIDNINKLLHELFDSRKSKVLKDKSVYDIIRFMFTNQYISREEKESHVINKIKRASVTKYDIAFSNWLCNNGFNGYYAEELPQKFGMIFPSEIMLCNIDDVEVINSIEMRRSKRKNLTFDYLMNI